jgi:hypothetical protein
MRKDFITSLVLVLFGSVVVVEALRMPRFEHLGINPYTVPGIVPGFLGAVIALFGVLMLGRTWVAWRRGHDVPATPADREPGSTSRVLVTLGLTLAYGGVLIGRMPFWLATFVFVWGFLLVFEWRPAFLAKPAALPERRVDTRALVRYASTAVVEAVLVAAAVTFVFERVFLVRLP